MGRTYTNFLSNDTEEAVHQYYSVHRGGSELGLMTGRGSEGMSLLTNYASGAPHELSSGIIAPDVMTCILAPSYSALPFDGVWDYWDGCLLSRLI